MSAGTVPGPESPADRAVEGCLLPRSCARQDPLSAERALKLFKWQGEWQSQHVSRDSLAEWSKALASGASP